MKRVISFIFALLLLAACGTGRQASTSDPKPESSPSSVSESVPAPTPSSSEPSSAESEPEGTSAPESTPEIQMPEESSAPESTPEIQKNETLLDLCNTYLLPLDYTAIGYDWDWPGNPPSNWLNLFESLYYHENGHLPYEDYGADWPVEEMTATVNRYFDGVTRQMVITSNYRATYDATTDTLHYEGGRGGSPNPLRAIGVERDSGQIIVYYESYDRETETSIGTPYALTAEIMEDGSFRYRSNHATTSESVRNLENDAGVN